MQDNELERLLRRTMRRTDILRAVFLGVMMGMCVVVSAYVSLAAGLWTGIAAMILLGAFWSYTRRQRQRPIAQRVTAPALTQAFERPAYSLPGRLPREERELLFPGQYAARCRDLISAQWQGLPFTFANVTIRSPRTPKPVFQGQWLVVHTDWQMQGRVSVRERRADEYTTAQEDNRTVLPAVDSELKRSYVIDADTPGEAAALLGAELMRALLLGNPGTRLLAQDGIVHLAIPSEGDFFELTGLEEEIAQVSGATQQHIAAIQAWLDGILSVDLPRRSGENA